MVGKKKLDDALQVGIRLPMDIVRRADAYAAALSAEHPGMTFTRTDAMRIILAKHLPPLPDTEQRPAPEPASPPRKPKQR
jgi:hypothetical protein